jgi:hypothetical protein
MVFQIDVDVIHCVSVAGHSMADGWAISSRMFTEHPHLKPIVDLSLGAVDLDQCYWRNIFVATSAQALPNPATHAAIASTADDVKWLDLTIANIKQAGDLHPHDAAGDGFTYPNNRGSCYPRYFYNAWVVSGFNGFHQDYSTYPGKFNGTLVGIEIPLMVAWRDEWGSQVGLAKVAFSSTFFLPQEQGPPAGDWLDPDFGGPTPASAQIDDMVVPSSIDPSLGEFCGYWTPRLMFDWSPGTDRIFSIWCDKLLGAKAALPAGKKMSVDLILNWFGDNDASARSRQYLEASFKSSCLRMIARQREFLVANNLTNLPLKEIPVVWMKAHPGYNNAAELPFETRSFVNQCLDEIATDDPFVRALEVDDYENLSDDTGTVPPLGMGAGATHLSHNGYVDAAADVMAAWREMRKQGLDSIAPADRVPVDEALEDVQARYDRGGDRGSVRRDAGVRALNQSLRHIVNAAGDSCWWLNRTFTMSLTFGSDGVCSLPLHVARVLEIRDVADAGRYYQFRQVGFGDGGRCQIVFENEDARCRGTGTYLVKHIGWPSDLSDDESCGDQLLPLPRQLLEWATVETCKRLASATDNVAKYAMLNGEAAAVQAGCMRQLARQAVAQRDAMHNERPRWQLGY